MAKVGRNEPCPCGSGRKYKRCHGSPLVRSGPTPQQLAKMTARADAERIQRERQQGLGKPIITATFKGQRLVAVKNRLLHSKRWLTFEDFLFDYIKVAMGSAWGNAELTKPPEECHPVLLWYRNACDYLKQFVKEPGKVHSAPGTGAVTAYLHLAYDLYALDHNAELQDKLLARLRNHDNFTGARYEVYVAATFIRAGFDIEFENEDDRDTSHCEFTATYRKTGKRFSVESKRREGRRVRIGHLFNNALSKDANHARVIFIDMNARDDAVGDHRPAFLEKALGRVRSFEGQLLNGQPRPPAYVFVTNSPWDLYLDLPSPRCTVLAEGFQIADFKSGVEASLRRVIDARETHIEMHELIKSIKDHAEIPSTFDGEIPEYAFNSGAQRILIGEHYMVPDTDGVVRPAEVTTATVAEAEGVAYCGVTFQDGRASICRMPLSSEELAAWRRHPDTFFGTVGQRSTKADSPLEFYDAIHEWFKRETRERLVELMADAPDREQLAKLDQPQLASIYAERVTNAAFATQHKGTTR
jgi:SEC-C motif